MTTIVPSKFIQQVNPKIIEIKATVGQKIEEAGGEEALKKAVGYGFHSNELWELAGVMFKTLSFNDQCRMAEIRQTDHFPYQVKGEWDSSRSFNLTHFPWPGGACFACEVEGDGELLTNNSCLHCHIPFETTPKLLTHVTAHILHDPSINWEDEPCGLCLLPAPSCRIVLKKYKHSFTVDYTHSTCQRLIKFSYAAASQPTALNPCGNVPINCPQCPKGSNTIWKYNMAFHYIKKHAPLVPPREFDVLDFELEGLWVVWSNHCATNWVGIRWRKHIMLKLNISAVHSLCLCLQYVL